MTLTIEQLYPEIANLHGDQANVAYLAQSRPDARILRTALTDAPAFLSGAVDLVHLGPLTERGQLRAIERLRPHRDRLAELIEAGETTFLFTHNALEVLGERIRNADMGYDVAGLGILPIEAELSMLGRYNGKVMGPFDGLDPAVPIVGYKSQFSMVTATESLPGFLTAERGIGRDTSTSVEGVRTGGLLGTSLLGPLLVANPHFTRHLLARLDPDTEPRLAHEPIAVAAYEARLAEFRSPRLWHATERVRAGR